MLGDDEWINVARYLDTVTKSMFRITSLFFNQLAPITDGRKELLTTAVAREGYLEIMKYCRKSNYEWTINTSTQAVNNSKDAMEVFKYLQKHKCDYNDRVMMRAVLASRIDFIRLFLVEFGYKGAYKLAINKGILEVIEFFHSKVECSISQYHLYAHSLGVFVLNKIRKIFGLAKVKITILDRVIAGDLDALKKSKDRIDYGQITRYAAVNGHLHILKYLKENNLMSREISLYCVVSNKHYEVLKWLNDNTLADSNTVCTLLAMNKDYDVFRWAMDANYPLDNTQNHLCSSNQLELLKLVINKMGKVDAYLLDSAGMTGNIEMLDYVYSLVGKWDSSAYSGAMHSGNIQTMKYLYKQGCPFDESLSFAVSMKGYIKMLEWLIKKGCPQSPHICHEAITRGNLNVVKWSYRRNGVGCFNDELAKKAILACKHKRVTNWIKKTIG